MKIAIIGAGISGLSIGRILSDKGHRVKIFEKSSTIGGIAKTRSVNDSAFHITGGHCFNSKHPDVLDFVFNNVLEEKLWNKVVRKSSIIFKDHQISYPIEFAMKEIANFDLELDSRMVQDYFNTTSEDRSNLASWFKSKFGNTLAEEYFIPYNEKIWNKKAEDMMPDWVEDKLPLPNKRAFAIGLLKNAKDSMPHSTFYYPASNNQNTFHEALANGQNIVFNEEITTISKDQSYWILNKQNKFDLIISTIPLNILPEVLDAPQNIKDEASKLKFNKVSTMLWKTKGVNDTWTYYPDANTLFHRHIHIGNFFTPNQNLTITEAVGSHSFDEMKYHGRKFNYLVEPIDHHISEHAYVVFDKNYKNSRDTLLNYIDKQKNLFTLGRFGEWEYYNMDVCIKSAIELAKKIS